jgi:YVTN family beta-propeller protein
MTRAARMTARRPATAAVLALALTVLTACSDAGPPDAAPSSTRSPTSPTAAAPSAPQTPSASPTTAGPAPTPRLLPGMPAPLRADDVWAADRAGAIAAPLRHVPVRVYVPNSKSDTVSIINPRTYKVVRTVAVGHEPQHVVPSWDLRTLWVNNDLGNSLTPINPRTGRFGRPIRVADPYNLYFTPDGRHAVVMASRLHRLVFRDPHTMRVRKSVPVPCAGVNHADFTTDGRRFLVSCEFSAKLLVVDTAAMRLRRVIQLPGSAMPQDVKLSTDGTVFFVADMMRGGVWIVDARTFRIKRFLRTGSGAHGLYVTRDSKRLLVTNRGAGSVSVVDMKRRRVVDTWHIRGGGSPDMGGLSPDGRVFWVSGRYDAVVYAISTRTGRLIRKIPVGTGPHGLSIFPQPGRYSLGHTGVFR